MQLFSNMSGEYINLFQQLLSADKPSSLRHQFVGFTMLVPICNEYIDNNSILKGIKNKKIDMKLILTILAQIDIKHYKFTYRATFKFMSTIELTKEDIEPCLKYLEDVVQRMTHLTYTKQLIKNIEIVLMLNRHNRYNHSRVLLYNLIGFATLYTLDQHNIVSMMKRIHVYYSVANDETKLEIVNMLKTLLTLRVDILQYIIPASTRCVSIVTQALNMMSAEYREKFVSAIDPDSTTNWTVDCLRKNFRKIFTDDKITPLYIYKVYTKCIEMVKKNVVLDSREYTATIENIMMFEIVMRFRYETIVEMAQYLYDENVRNLGELCLIHYDQATSNFCVQ